MGGALQRQMATRNKRSPVLCRLQPAPQLNHRESSSELLWENSPAEEINKIPLNRLVKVQRTAFFSYRLLGTVAPTRQEAIIVTAQPLGEVSVAAPAVSRETPGPFAQRFICTFSHITLGCQSIGFVFFFFNLQLVMKLKFPKFAITLDKFSMNRR